MSGVAEKVYGNERGAVPEGRRFASAALRGHTDELIGDVELVVSELLTNACLHGQAPFTLRVSDDPGTVRVEVCDASNAMPIRMLRSSDAMTGRGLGLVEALSRDWGIDPLPGGGKVVWANLSTDRSPTVPDATPLDVDALLAAWPDDAPTAGLFTVRLGAVPTALLVAAKSHIDNVVRELALLAGRSDAGGAPLPPELDALVRTVTDDFAEARAQIKRQAAASAARGDPVTDLELRLPVTSAEAGERYLAALDQADRYARGAQLLTLAAPSSHRAFRRWYVGSLVDQLRAVAAGEPPPAAVPFPLVLAGEVDRLAGLDVVAARLELLQRVNSELTNAVTVPEVADVVVAHAARFPGVVTARAYVLEGDELRSVAGRGVNVDGYDVITLRPDRPDLPGTAVIESGRPLSFRSVTQLEQQFPSMAGVYPSDRSLHISPLVVGGHVLGIFVLTFSGGEVTDEAQTSFVEALADALAQALERSVALSRAAAASERLTFLADASVALSASLDFDATLVAVTELMVPRLADWCSVQLRRGDALETMAVYHRDPARASWGRLLSELYPTSVDDPTGSALVIRTGTTSLLEEIPDELYDQIDDPEYVRLLRELRLTSSLVVPLTGRSGTFGALILVYAESGRHYSAADVPFAEDVASRVALALETAQSFLEQSGRLAMVTRVAEAAQRAILGPPPARLGSLRLAARYASATADALVGGDLYEVVAVPGAVRMLVGDVRGKGVGAVRTTTIVLGEFRALSEVEDLAEVMRRMDHRVGLYLGDEDFVTAVIAEVRDDGSFTVANCGHPPPLVVHDGRITPLEPSVGQAGLPLGLGGAPAVLTGSLPPGGRLVLHTDGLLEARTPDGGFVDFATLVAPLASGDIDVALDRILQDLHDAVGGALTDDLALLVAEHAPEDPAD